MLRRTQGQQPDPIFERDRFPQVRLTPLDGVLGHEHGRKTDID
jgi:hypothetical protein